MGGRAQARERGDGLLTEKKKPEPSPLGHLSERQRAELAVDTFTLQLPDEFFEALTKAVEAEIVRARIHYSEEERRECAELASAMDGRTGSQIGCAIMARSSLSMTMVMQLLPIGSSMVGEIGSPTI